MGADFSPRRSWLSCCSRVRQDQLPPVSGGGVGDDESSVQMPAEFVLLVGRHRGKQQALEIPGSCTLLQASDNDSSA